MNYLKCTLHWDTNPNNIEKEVHQDLLDLQVQRIHSFTFDKMSIYYNDKTNITCAILGYISNIAEVKRNNNIDCNYDVEIIEELFSRKGKEFIKDLDGIYLIFLHDKASQKAYFILDHYGFNLPLYYTIHNNHLLICTRLKDILNYIPPNERKLCMKASRTFLYSQIIPGGFTLIEGINKLSPGQYLEIDCRMKSYKIINRMHTQNNKASLENAKKELIPSIKKNIEYLSTYLETKRFACTQSSGFDSNLIVKILSEISEETISTFTIGSRYINEIPAVEKIVQQYKNVVNKKDTINDNSLDYFPDLVWKLEGYVYEGGTLLRYPLAKLLNKNGIHSVFIAECADQILDFNKFSKRHIIIKRIKFIIKSNLFSERFLIKYRKMLRKENFLYPKIKNVIFPNILKLEFELDQILKQSGILLNNYDIQGIYPFINKDTKKIAITLGYLNKKKNLYKEQVQNVLSDEISKLLNKSDRVIDINYQINNNSDIFRKLLDSRFAEKFLRKDQIAKIMNDLNAYSDFILMLLYLHLFNELFISGRFDSIIYQRDLNISLKELIET